VVESRLGFDAKILAMAVATGLVPCEEAVQWADKLIAQLDSPSQSLIDVSMSGHDINGLVSALEECAAELGAGESPAVWRDILAYWSDWFDDHEGDGPRIAGILRRMAWFDAIPDCTTREEMLAFSDSYDLASTGILAFYDVDFDLSQFLGRFRDTAT